MDNNLIILSDKHKMMLNYVDVIKDKSADSLIISGDSGSGKSFTITEYLTNNNVKFAYHPGFSTPLSMYKFIYNNRDKLIVFDDTLSIVKNTTALTILLSALWPVMGKRKLKWSSTSGALEDVPDEFDFRGQILFIMNNLPNNNVFPILINRAMHFNLSLTYEEYLRAMERLSNIPTNNLTVDERRTVYNFIEKESSPTTLNFSLRTQNKIEDLYRVSRSNWKGMARDMLSNRSIELEIIRQLTKKPLTVIQQIKIFREKTGLGRSSYFLYKNKLKTKIGKKSKSPTK